MREQSFIVRFLTQIAEQLRELLYLYAQLAKIELKESVARFLAVFFLLLVLLGTLAIAFLFACFTIAFFISDVWQIPRYVGFAVVTLLFIVFWGIFFKFRSTFRNLMRRIVEKMLFEDQFYE
ncbi:MAG: phage holin family protein [Cytophagales bacterium]|nr:phage holin family protein [Cytophagales bacterium]MDW8383642.1 phage holin family protein [Flammeovirgaceae bacterium]